MWLSNRGSWAVPGDHVEYQSAAAVCRTAGTGRSDVSETGSACSLGRRWEMAFTACWSAATPRDETRPLCRETSDGSGAGIRTLNLAIFSGPSSSCGGNWSTAVSTPAPSKPTGTLTTPADPNRTSAFFNVCVANIDKIYREWSAKGAHFLSEPKDHGREIRAYVQDPDGHLIEVGQTTRRLG